MKRQYKMRRPDVGLSHSSSVVQATSSVPSSTRGRLRSSTGSLISPPAGSGGWTLPPLNQFMTLPGSFLASMDNIYTTRSNESVRSTRSNESVITTTRHINSIPSINGHVLDNLLNDEEEEWNAPAHFVLPHMVHRNAVISTESIREQEEIDLTVSSSEDEEVEFNGFLSDSDDVIEIIETPGTAPLHRKRRRSGADTSKDAVLKPKRQRSMDMVRSTESTNVGMRNNEMLQKFKSELKCTICLDVLEDITSTICGHIYCAGCIRQAIRTNGKCPLCQRRLHFKDIHPLFF